MLENHLFNIIKPHFKSLNNTKLKSLSTAIACVALGLRASHLVDVAYLDLDVATSLLNSLRKISTAFMLLQFKDRFTFLCNKNRFKNHLNSTLNQPDQWIYISVEGKEPIRLMEPPIHLISWLEKIKTIEDDCYYSPIVPPFMVALTGWALEYPVIYTTHLASDDPEKELDEWEPRSNCLGSQVLSLIQVWISSSSSATTQKHMLFSFSYPFVSLSVQESENIQWNLRNKINLRLQQQGKSWNHVQLDLSQIKLDRFAL